jgi:hypothetical protein
MSEEERLRRGHRWRAIGYGVLALVCFASGYVLLQSPRYGVIAVVVQLVLAFAWTLAALMAWRASRPESSDGF